MPTDNQKNQEQILCSWVYHKFNNAHSAKSEREVLDKKCMDAYYGKNLLQAKPEHASNHVSNLIFSTIETIRPIMTDNNPQFQALARTPEGKEKARKIQTALDYEWDRENMRSKLSKAILTALQTGTAIFYLKWDKQTSNVKCVLVNPLSIYPDPMATSFDDAEYVIYATYQHINQLKKMYPEKASQLIGSDVSMPELTGKKINETTNTQVLVLECWTRDYTYIDVEEVISGQKVKNKKMKYPNGRVITCAPILGVVLSDSPSPYKDGKFPFVALKDYDVPFEFWGRGEVEQLLSPQAYMNELNNCILDNAKHTANVPWVVDKNSGIPYNGLSNRPGLVIRKNPGSEVSRPAPPNMPIYVQNKVMELKQDIESIAGVHDVTQGRQVSGVTAAQAILALQEAGQSRIRLKVRIMEDALSELACMWYSRMQQFWKKERSIRIVDGKGKVTVDVMTSEDLKYDYDIKITAGSTMTMNRSAILDMMIRLAQSPAEDGLPMVDREAVVEYLPTADKYEMLDRFKNNTQQQMAQQMQAQQEQLQQTFEQIFQAIEQLAKEVQTMSKEHGKIKEEAKQKEIFNKGMQRGINQQDLTDSEIYDIIHGGKKIPDDILLDIESLGDDEMQQLLQAVPNLQEILENNA